MRNYILIALVFILILAFQSGNCQIDSFQIKEYKYPDVIRKTLLVTPQLSFINYNNNSPSANIREQIFMANANFRGFEFVNREKRQSTLSYNGQLGYRKFNDSPTNPNRRNGVSFFKSLGWVNRLFFKPKRFFELESASTVSYNFDSWSLTPNKELFLSLDITPKIGLGRIEIVSDAWHTITILNMLNEKGLLLKEISKVEINAIAQTISELKNYRNPDNRLEAIYEYEQLCKYLIDNGFCSADNYRFFSILRDAYDFEGFRVREHGHNLKLGVNMDLRHYDYNSETTVNLDYKIYTVVFEYVDKNAINDKWQFDQSYMFKKGDWNVSSANSNDYNKFNYTTFRMSQTFGYYMSRRTFATAGFSSFVTNFDRGDFSRIDVFANLDYFYYLSPNTQLYINSFYSLNDDYSILDLNDDRRFTSIFLGVNHFFY